jgi:hypothetical protein
MAIGRISGPLLKSNLLRNGVDLAFETDLLYLDVNNRRIGVKTTSPQYPLDVNGIARVTDLEITNPVFQIGNVTLNGTTSTISTTAQEFAITTTDSVIVGNRVEVGDLEINNSFIENTNTNSDLFIRSNGTGTINIEGNTTITGNLHATGNITADGDIQIGDDDTDTITLNAEIASDIIPDANDTYTIGTADKRWASAYINSTFVDTLTTNDIDFGDLDLISTPGNIFYVAQNGSDTATGEHPQDPVATIEYALTLAQPGDTVYIYPGQYQEVFPLTVGQGVTVRGQSLRSVEITPDSTSQSEDVFLMNGESTVEEVTIKNFYYDSGNDKGYAFRFAPNMNVTLRSPYVRNVTVITQGTTVTSADPRGFDSADAGAGVFLDGSVVDTGSREASMLFHAVTFITPGVTGLKATNGARIEWLNSFTYFADKGINLYDSADGFAGAGKTKLKVSGLSGVVANGETITYYDTDGTTVLGTGTVETADGNYFYLDGKVTGWELAPTRARKTVTAKGNAALIGNAQVGSTSLSLTTEGDLIEVITQPDFGFGTEDFSVEAWVNLDSNTGIQTLFDFRAGSTLDIALHVYFDDSNIKVAVGSTLEIEPATTFNTTNWYHIAISRVSNTTKLFVNGSNVGSFSDSNNYGTTKPFKLGADFNRTNTFISKIDEVRIRKGGGYSSNFTPSTNPLPVTTNTVLMLHMEGEVGSTIILDDDVFVQDIRFSGGDTAEKFELVDYSDFGAEIRSIASASVYGNYGIYADGPGVVAYLIGQNLAYIGNGKETDNDPSTVIQANEVVKLNDANVYYSTVDHKGDFRVGDLFTVNQETGEVSFTNAEFLFNNNEGITFTDGTNTTIIDGSKVQTGNIRFSGNTVESVSGDLNFDAASGAINLLDDVNISGSLDVTGNVTIGGNITLGDAATDSIQITAAIDSDILPNITDTYNLGSETLAWQELHTGKVLVDTLEINDNYIKATDSVGDINLITNASGEVVIDDIRIKDNVIRNITGSIVLSPSSDVVEVQGTGSLVLPKGTTAERPGTPEVGMIRFNTETGVFEAYDGTWTELGGVYDVDRDTYITPELTPGANDNTIRFYAGGNLVADVNTERFDAVKIEVDDIEISGNILQTITTNQDLELRANGTGTISIENFAFNGGTITNLVDGDVTTLEQTGTGYFKVPGTGGFVIPSGNNEQRHPTPETGMMRYNTVEDRVEIYDIGGNWVSVAGSTGAVSFNDAEDIAIKFALTL